MFQPFIQYRGRTNGPKRFWPVDASQIIESEQRLELAFPSTLRQFFTDVGAGFWAKGVEDRRWDRSLVNRILAPAQIADLLLQPENVWRPYEGFVEGVLPFFDLGENTYLVIRPRADFADRVYWPDGKLVVSETLQEFFDRLSRRAAFYRDM